MSAVDQDVANKTIEIFNAGVKAETDMADILGDILKYAKFAYVSDTCEQLADAIAAEDRWPEEYDEALGHFQGILYSMAREFSPNK